MLSRDLLADQLHILTDIFSFHFQKNKIQISKKLN